MTVLSLDHLLPEANQAPRCADHTRAIAVDPVGTAIRADRIVLVETSLPWPKPVFDHPTLREIAPVFKAAAIPTRLLACVPVLDQPTRVHVFDRRDTPVVHTRERRFTVHSPNELLDLAFCLTAETDGGQSGAEAEWDRPVAEPTVLICTQGSHDICCGSDGARLAAGVEQLEPRPRLYRVSHTGGHRFAPTAMTLPDGRMWAYLIPELLASIVDQTADPAELAQYCRGWWGADKGAAQAAERAVFAHFGWDVDHVARSVTTAEPTVPGQTGDSGRTGPGTVTAEVVIRDHDRSGEGRVIEVAVEATRTVPTIGCRVSGGRPAKSAVEYRSRVLAPPSA